MHTSINKENSQGMSATQNDNNLSYIVNIINERYLSKRLTRITVSCFTRMYLSVYALCSPT